MEYMQWNLQKVLGTIVYLEITNLYWEITHL